MQKLIEKELITGSKYLRKLQILLEVQYVKSSLGSSKSTISYLINSMAQSDNEKGGAP